jgi:hypothetical protein
MGMREKRNRYPVENNINPSSFSQDDRNKPISSFLSPKIQAHLTNLLKENIYW